MSRRRTPSETSLRELIDLLKTVYIAGRPEFDNTADPYLGEALEHELPAAPPIHHCELPLASPLDPSPA